MSVQLALRFDEVPITCETQKRYHSIAPCLAGKRSAEEQADALGLSYNTICRWLRQFREHGLPGLFRQLTIHASHKPRNMSLWRCFFTRLVRHGPPTGNWRES